MSETTDQQSGSESREVASGSTEGRNVVAKKRANQDALALAFTAAIVAFVGAVVVLTIPFAVFSAPLPASINRLGLSVEASQNLLFERVWYLLVSSILFALWIGYKSYRWGRSAGATTSNKPSGDAAKS